MTLLSWSILAYVAIQFAVAIAVSRRIRTEEDYLVGGRSLGFAVVMFSVFSTWFGAESLVGAAGAAYEEGLAGNSGDPFGYGIGLLLLGALFAGAFWRMKILTLGDFVRRRYSVAAERVFVALYVPSSAFWAAAQLRAFGEVLASTSTLGVAAGVTVAAVVTVAYTAIGGLKADAITDVIQSLVLVGGLVWLFGSIWNLDGFEWTAIPAEKFDWRPAGLSRMEVIESWAVPVLGSMFTAEMISRVVAARTPEAARRGAVAGAMLYLAVGLLVVALGLAGTVLIAELANPEHVLLRLIADRLGVAAQVIFAGALISSILSTLDTVLLVTGSLCAHNVVLPLLKAPTAAQRLRINRIAVVGAGALAYGLALGGQSVKELVEEASAFAGGGFFAIILFGLTTRWGGSRAAICTLLTGMGVYLGAAYVARLSWPFTLSVIASVAVFLVVSRFAGGRAGAEAERLRD